MRNLFCTYEESIVHNSPNEILVKHDKRYIIIRMLGEVASKSMGNKVTYLILHQNDEEVDSVSVKFMNMMTPLFELVL